MGSLPPLHLFPGEVGVQIFVAHDFTNPPLRRYRRPFQQLSDKYGVDFKFADDIHAAEHLLEQIENLIATSDYSLFDVSTWNWKCVP